jgi:hypothetical protein
MVASAASQTERHADLPASWRTHMPIFCTARAEFARFTLCSAALSLRRGASSISGNALK